MLTNARRAYARLTLDAAAARGHAHVRRFVAEEAVAGADLVQESAPERVELKQRLLAAASAAAGPEVVFCSSTSGLLPSLLQAEMQHPERLVVGHPFNPVYLLPLVELCAGGQTAPETVEPRRGGVPRRRDASAASCGHEIDGFIADRLLEALWREALWLVHDDVATVDEIDDAIRYGAGLRWAIMGTFLTYRIAGGEDGMRALHGAVRAGAVAALDQARRRPRADAAFLDKLAAQSDAQADGQSIAELERHRDDCLVAILQALRAQGVGAGETLAALGAGPAAHRSARPDGDRPAAGRRRRLRLLAREIPPDWLDYNGHVTESRYLQLFGDATDALLRLHRRRRRVPREPAGPTTRSRRTSPTSGSCTPAIGSR